MNITDRKYIHKRNADGTGFILLRGVVTLIEQRRLFLKTSSNCNYKTDEKATVPAAGIGTSTSTDAEIINFSISGSKRKVDDQSEDDELTKETSNNVKRIKIGNDNNANSSIEDEEKTPVEELLFSNDLLLRTIFSKLDIQALKCCRLVNRLWDFEATKILLKHNNLAAIQLSDDAVKLDDVAVYKRPISLQDFKNIVSNSKSFPVTSFVITNKLLSDNVKQFLRDNQHLVKSLHYLSINTKKKNPTVNDIILLASNSLPFIQVLQFEGNLITPLSKQQETELDHAPEFSNLRTLKLYQEIHPRTLSLLLKKARHLENFYFDNRTNDIRILNRWLKFDNIIPPLKNMQFIFWPTCLEINEKVLDQKPKFKIIEMIDVNPEEDPWLEVAEVGRFLTRMFHQCAESLTQILGFRPLGHITGLTLPVCPNVKRLVIEFNCIRMSRAEDAPLAPLLPSGVNLAEAFPNLTTVEIATSMTRGGREEIFSRALGPLFSVRELKVWGNLTDSWAEQISYFFPNAISAKFQHMLEDSAYQYVWKLSKLQELHVVILTERNNSKLFPELDSAFTGFSVETVEKLFEKEQADLNLTKEEIATLRIKPSIADLKELRKLSISLGLSDVQNTAYEYEDSDDSDDSDNNEDDDDEAANEDEDDADDSDDDYNIALNGFDFDIEMDHGNDNDNDEVDQANDDQNVVNENDDDDDFSVRFIDDDGKDEDQDDNKDDDILEKRNLEIIFDPGDGDGKILLQVKDKTVLSYLTKYFGFDLCPQLKSNVSVAFTHYTKLKDEEAEAQ